MTFAAESAVSFRVSTWFWRSFAAASEGPFVGIFEGIVREGGLSGVAVVSSGVTVGVVSSGVELSSVAVLSVEALSRIEGSVPSFVAKGLGIVGGVAFVSAIVGAFVIK